MGTHKPIMETPGDRKWKWLARCWLAVGLAVSALLLVRAMPHSPLRGSTQQAKPTAVAGATVNSAQGTTASVGVPTGHTETVYVRRLITQPIETIRVGQRVLGTNPNRDEVEAFEEPDPKTWRTIEVEQVKPSGKKLYATLLRPLEWIEEEIDPATNTLELDLPELGAEGTAKVLRIGPCPPIAAGNSHIVTATFKHEPDGELLTVTVSGDEISCTANHPFWSEDRQEFVEAGQLRQGERVRTRLEEVAAVVAVKPRPPTAWVYNLEVQGEHVYEVGPNGVLVHNAYQYTYIIYRVVRHDGSVYIGRAKGIGTVLDVLKARFRNHKWFKYSDYKKATIMWSGNGPTDGYRTTLEYFRYRGMEHLFWIRNALRGSAAYKDRPIDPRRPEFRVYLRAAIDDFLDLLKKGIRP